MEKRKNIHSSQKRQSFDISKYYKNETPTYNQILTPNYSNFTPLRSNEHLNAKNKLLNLLEVDNFSFIKFTLSNKKTNGPSFDFSDAKIETNKEADRNNEAIDHNKKYQNECESSDISD